MGRHGSTYGGNPVACAAALASIDVIEKDNLLENATKMGEYFMGKLNEFKSKYSFIREVRGLGLMIGMEVVDETGAPDGELIERMVDYCFKSKLLLLDCGIKNHIIRFVPPLNVSKRKLIKHFPSSQRLCRLQRQERRLPADEKAAADKKTPGDKQSDKDVSIAQPIS